MGFREYLNEASTLKTIGVNNKQIKAVYSTIQKRWDTITIDATASFEEIKSKKSVTDLMRANGVSSAVVVGLAGENMFYTIQTQAKGWDYKSDEYITYEVDASGKINNTWTERSSIKALSYFKGVKSYFVARAGAVKAKAINNHGVDNARGEKIAWEFAKLIEKDMEKLFKEAKAQFTKNITATINAGDLVKAQYMLNKLVVDDGSSSWKQNYVEKEFSDFLVSGWDNDSIYTQIKRAITINNGESPDGWGSIPRVRLITNDANTKEIRAAAVEVLKDVKEKIKSIIEA
jgi:hypothetical protein